MVDSGYANDLGFLAPFRSITYHLEEFKKRNSSPSGREEVFNYTHASLRNVVERTFGVWKERWHILNEARSYPYSKQRLIPIACAVLHNFLYMINHDPQCLHMYLHPEEDDDGVNEDDENEDEDEQEDDGPPEPVPCDRQAMVDVRSRMADEMYAAYRRSPWYGR